MAQTPDQRSLQSVLLGDVTRALTLRPRDDFSRRATIRAVLGTIEGILGTLQSELLSAAGQELSGPERAFLREGTHVLTGNGTGNGKVGNVPAKLSLRQRVELTAALVTRLRPECKCHFEEAGWRDLLSSLNIRDRLTHPKDRADLEVTDAELRAAVIGQVWFLDNLVAVVQTGLRDYRESDANERSALPHALRASLPPLRDSADTTSAGVKIVSCDELSVRN